MPLTLQRAIQPCLTQFLGQGAQGLKEKPVTFEGCINEKALPPSAGPHLTP